MNDSLRFVVHPLFSCPAKRPHVHHLFRSIAYLIFNSCFPYKYCSHNPILNKEECSSCNRDPFCAYSCSVVVGSSFWLQYRASGCGIGVPVVVGTISGGGGGATKKIYVGIRETHGQ